MGFGGVGWWAGALAGLWLGWAPAPASAADLCAPSEATDPQPLHINGSTPFVYKTVGGAALRLHVFRSAGLKPGARVPAVVFFYGGGFYFGDLRRYQTQATHLALRGVATVLADYRVKCRQGSTIMDSIADGASAMQWVRGHAAALGIDPGRIAAAGSSSGALIAVAATLTPALDKPGDATIDPRPNALILYNPPLDTASPAVVQSLIAQWGQAAADQVRGISPMDHLDRGLPPTIIFQGTADTLVSPAAATDFCRRARALKDQCEVVLYPGAPHGFSEVWMGLQDPAAFPRTEYWAEDTSRRTDEFLTRLGWLAPG